MTKAEIRQYYLNKRKQLSPQEMENKQQGLMKHFALFDMSPFSVVHLFLSIHKQLEPNTQPLMEHLFSEGKTVVASQSDFKTKQMTHWAVSQDNLWKTNRYGIPEPTKGTPVLPSAIDLVFVPLLGYDVQGQRVGYGQGFYDRFLSACASNTVFVGLSYFPPEPEITDCEPTDVRLHHCIHSEGIVRF
jgi:5-formyltetrahydrofolate cyclo-ligase